MKHLLIAILGGVCWLNPSPSNQGSTDYCMDRSQIMGFSEKQWSPVSPSYPCDWVEHYGKA